MHTRRKFLIQGSMATTAMLAFKPFKTIASTVSHFTGYNSYGKLMFLHTALPDHQCNQSVIQQLSNIKRDHAIVLHAGETSKQFDADASNYDSCIDEINNQPTTGGYKIVRKGNIKTGIISAMPGEENVIEKVNNLSSWLKKEKGCTVVVCLSQLGYKNENTPDDITLAAKSVHVDLIIGGKINNFHKLPVILLNRNNEEVIIHSAVNNDATIGKIEIEFNGLGLKNKICFSNQA